MLTRGVDDRYFAELLTGLAWIGKPVAASLRERLRRALADAHSRRAAGESLDMIERDVQVDDEDLTEMWYPVASITQARLLLEILGSIGDAGAAPLFVEALRSPVEPIRLCALLEARYLAAPETFPAIQEQLYDERTFGRPDLRICDAAVEVLAWARSRSTIRMDKLSIEKKDSIVRRFRAEFEDSKR